ncbi:MULTISPECIES: YesL family protein [unclassified Streptococcus]|uniref:YesL family protein n=1 Tax=unclassified Streptococcus TaxID=2608887 RepID=UPI0010727AC3|nr:MULTISPECIES: DUF624 domain-containing protein [unclassified Streptococcus]MBF0787109.1 DUF624 domain-containing protein [Streptococcus sp. 19428wC2_LYSM12]MCQ9211335.1 DUF624 domain-containing protein [Streptococcus sp. B01]MCQ9214647.1 DUF624 domain-containing protein [Streptococcus sp. O1]TFV05993.1 DUF624 domain-containing protein [Streptococcus sp. LYSM12]
MGGIFHPNGLAMKCMNWLADMCQIQLLWIFYSLRGGIVLGLFPATRAMFYMHRQLIMKNEVASLSQQFKMEYRQHFKRANQMGYVISGIGAFLMLYLRSTLLLKIDFAFYFIALAYALVVFFILLNLYMLVMLSHLKLDEKEVWRQALFVIFLSPGHTLLILLVLFAFFFMVRVIPVLTPVLLIAVLSYVVSYVALKAINKVICHYQ